jgi:peptide/nickel transport system permease protein
MARFLGRRLLFGLLVLWIVSGAVFVLFFVAPHDPARLIAGKLATPQTIALVNHRLGLDRPLPEQYVSFIRRLLHGDLGYSYYSNAPVSQLLASRLPVTVSLSLGGAVLWLVVGIGVGVAAARRPRSLVDRGGAVLMLAGLSMPTFLVGLLLIYFLFLRLHLAGITWFPRAATSPWPRTPSGGPSTCCCPGSPWPP